MNDIEKIKRDASIRALLNHATTRLNEARLSVEFANSREHFARTITDARALIDEAERLIQRAGGVRCESSR